MATDRKTRRTDTPRPAAEPVLTRALAPMRDRDADGPAWSALLDHHGILQFSAVNTGYLQLGLATVMLARRYQGTVICAHFVVDLMANGVIDCFGEAFTRDQFELYLTDIDQRLPLEWCPETRAAGIVRTGEELGRKHGVPQAEALYLWGRILPKIGDPAEHATAIFGDAGRPLAVGDLILPHRSRALGPCFSDQRGPQTPTLPRRDRDH